MLLSQSKSTRPAAREGAGIRRVTPSEPSPRMVKVKSQKTFEYVFGADRTATGTSYRFPPLGVLLVDERDLGVILSVKSRGGGCCGSSSQGGVPYFSLEV